MPAIPLPPGELLPDWDVDSAGQRVPAKISVEDFRRYFLASFPKLSSSDNEAFLQDALDMVYAMFTGIGILWDWHPAEVWYEKTRTCYRFLAAWYIADIRPELVSGVVVMGGTPLKRKKVDGVDIVFADSVSKGNTEYLDLLESLKSNAWGAKAYLMIRSAGKRVMLRNRRIV